MLKNEFLKKFIFLKHVEDNNLAKNLVYFKNIFCDLPVYFELVKDIFSNNNIIVNCDNWIFFQPRFELLFPDEKNFKHREN